MGPYPVWSSPGFYPWSATVYYLYIWALHIVGCSTLYTGLPACRLSCFKRVMRSAARLIGKIQKFDHVTRYMLDVPHWLPVRQRIQYSVVSLVWRCQLGLSPCSLPKRSQSANVG